MEEERVYKLHVKMCTRWYPKPNKPEPQNNDWQIVRAKVIKAIDSDDSLELEYGQLTLVGNMVVMEPGATYLVYVTKGWNEKFNKIQYDIQYSQEVREFKTKQQIEDFLEMFITPRQIKALYSITDEPLKLIDEHNVEELCNAAGIGAATAERIISRYEACKDYGPAYGELGQMGITKTLIDKLIGFYNSADTVLDIIKNRPYMLADDIKGIGFLKADEIALKNGFDRHDIERVKAFIVYTMNDVANNVGSTYISYTYLMDKIDEIIGRDTPQDVIDDALDFLIDNKIVWCNDKVFEDGTVETTLALKRYYDIEKELAYHIRRLIDAPSNITLSDKEINEKIKDQEKRQGWCYTDTQKYGVKVIADNNVVIIRGYGGCVDCDTEYFNGYEWKRIADYEEGEMVLQWHTDGHADLVKPLEYIKKPEETLYHFETKYGLDQCLSLEHRVVYESCKGKLKVEPFAEVIRQHNTNKNGFNGKFYTTFDYEGLGIDKTDDEIRLQIAYMADGSFNKNNDSTWCSMRLKKKRKQERIEMLLEKCGVPYEMKYEESTGFNIYKFYAPNREKEFESYWYQCNKHQFEVVCDEVLKWDGSTTSGKCRFGSISKKTIDFVQFAFATIGMRSAVQLDKRVGQPITGKPADKDYRHIHQCYGLNFTKKNKCGISGPCDRPGKESEGTKILPYKTKDGYKYCFSVPTTMLVLRRNGKIFITGNTGKSSTVAGLLSCLDDEYHFEQCALSGKASVNLTDITGIEGKTIHRLLKYNPSHGGFTYCEEEPLDTNMVILDEGSMVDISLALSLFQAIPTGAKLVILGDTNQLPPIGAGNLLQDMIDSEIIPVVTFDKIHRQGAKSGIIPFSIEVANGITHYKQSWEGEEVLGELQDLKMIGFKCARDDEKPSVDLIMREYKEMYQECKDASQITVVLPTNTRGTCTKVVNKLIQDYVLPRRTRGDFIEIGVGKEKCNVYRGDRILVLKNNYDLDIFNGNVGEVLAINKEDNSLIADFGRGEVEIKGKALNELDLGYAISTHKSQGSTLPYLIYCIDNTHYVMLNRQQVYTGITRAKKKATFIFETKALNSAIRTSKIKYVNTFLYHFLVGDLK